MRIRAYVFFIIFILFISYISRDHNFLLNSVFGRDHILLEVAPFDSVAFIHELKDFHYTFSKLLNSQAQEKIRDGIKFQLKSNAEFIRFVVSLCKIAEKYPDYNRLSFYFFSERRINFFKETNAPNDLLINPCGYNKNELLQFLENSEKRGFCASPALSPLRSSLYEADINQQDLIKVIGESKQPPLSGVIHAEIFKIYPHPRGVRLPDMSPSKMRSVSLGTLSTDFASYPIRLKFSNKNLITDRLSILEQQRSCIGQPKKILLGIKYEIKGKDGSLWAGGSDILSLSFKDSTRDIKYPPLAPPFKEKWSRSSMTVDRCENIHFDKNVIQGPFKKNCRSFWASKNGGVVAMATNSLGVQGAYPPPRKERIGIGRVLFWLPEQRDQRGKEYDKNHISPFLQRYFGSRYGLTEFSLVAGPKFTLDSFVKWFSFNAGIYDADAVFAFDSEENYSKIDNFPSGIEFIRSEDVNESRLPNERIAELMIERLKRTSGWGRLQKKWAEHPIRN